MGRNLWVALGGAVALLAGAPPAGAAVTIGSDLPTQAIQSFPGCTPSCTVGTAQHPAVAGTSPIDGVIVRWRTRFGEAFTGARLRVVRVDTGAPTITGVRTGPTVNLPIALNVMPLSPGLPIAAGETVGVDIFGDSSPTLGNLRTGAIGFQRVPAIADGVTASTGVGANTEIMLNADVELDADRDGFGDETQDQCPTSAAKQLECEPPESQIVKRPKKKLETERATVTVKFRFTSDEVGSTFECKLDRRRFVPCESPRRYRLKATEAPKKHTFLLRAIDAAGNADPTPARRVFRVERVD